MIDRTSSSLLRRHRTPFRCIRDSCSLLFMTKGLNWAWHGHDESSCSSGDSCLHVVDSSSTLSVTAAAGCTGEGNRVFFEKRERWWATMQLEHSNGRKECEHNGRSLQRLEPWGHIPS
ncbi:hypothetical protein MPTK1_5g20330 [Marchantia polymorpha subsp. ruderalis]|uniref:Uncharacterized protein n=2 Tax=Marchantia polymorpha TaxID=3197 RepID=A0AAF6BKD2_MARPO|nr:hypothetical protein MARPO_0058s0011 [Marchantia polymorpha]BBN12466.1 hypothetical protein Mp_5g20330 [Marchantia polymorpha subsp. ruderalis]|eukprot:PTQ37219.1 hypothetical protein MARPO_0058s0011 [Marchantia polymorpha]